MNNNAGKELKMRRFEMNQIRFHPDENKGPVIVLIGRRDTGKSFLIQDLLYFHRDVPMGTIISGTEAGNGFYKPIMPKILIHHEYDSSIIEGVLRRQKEVMKQVNRDKAQYGRSTLDPRTFLVLDDCLYDDKWTRDTLIRLVFMNGRHWKVMMLITMQYPMGIPPVLRTNIDYVFILREPVHTNRERIWKNYASMFPTLEAFCMIMDQTTENYECLVLDNNAKSNKITDMVFWYKAVQRPPYKLAAKEYWDMSAAAGDEEEEAEYNPMENRKRSAGAQIHVRKG